MAAATAAIARRAFQGSTVTSGLRSLSLGTAASSTKTSSFASATRFSRCRLPFFSRHPVELGCAESLIPLHSVTAAALLTSKLSLKSGSWGWLSEGFATPL